MRYRVELSKEAQKQLIQLPREVMERMERAIDDMEALDDSLWSNMKALQGACVEIQLALAPSCHQGR